MKRPLFPGFFSGRALALLLVLALLWPLSVPVSGFFWNKKSDGPKLKDFSNNGLIGSVIVFEPEDFVVQSGSQAVLDSITILSLPDPGSGVLTMGGQPLEEGATVERSALGGLRFQSAQAPTETTVSFTFSPIFSGSGSAGQDPVTVTLYLLTQANRAPEARNKDGSGRFVYTPYENKTGRDSFTYVALDQAGNASAPATVTLRIEKAGTKVRYADMDGDPAHKAALRLAETGVYVGQQVDSRYFFQPDATVSRAQFLTIAMAAVGMEPLDQVSLTGFADDQAIPTWAKGFVSAALKAGAIQGSKDENGAPVFSAGDTITQAEASVMTAINGKRTAAAKLDNDAERKAVASQNIDYVVKHGFGPFSSDVRFNVDTDHIKDGKFGFTFVAKYDYKDTKLDELIKKITNGNGTDIKSNHVDNWTNVGVVVKTVNGQTYIAVSVAIDVS